MNTPIEAQSLSSLNHLFSNPPQYPRNPTHEVHNPLVLYIVRVPGSRDVFLTPLKPPTKASISLEAIQSSLYYLHVLGPEDEVLRQSIEDERYSADHETVPVARKPLPPVPFANYPPYDRPCPPPKSYPHFQRGINGVNDTQIDRLAARGSHLRINSSSSPAQLRTRQFHSSPNENYKSLHRGSLPSQTSPPSYDDIADRNSDESAHSIQHAVKTENGHGSRFSTSPQRLPSPERLTIRHPSGPRITLIRRDPASGGQWNIGTIQQLQSDVPESNLNPVSINLTTPGYVRFSQDREVIPSTIEDAILREEIMRNQSVELQDTSNAFTRIVDFRQQTITDRSKKRHGRVDSFDVIQMKSGSRSKAERNVLSFASPWQGQCTFSNGVDGRTLRCKHGISSGSTGDVITSNLAELRFNLPWSVLRVRDNTKLSQAEPDKLPIPKLLETKKENFRHSLQQLKHRSMDRKSDDLKRKEGILSFKNVQLQQKFDSDDEIERISLKLGREKAGGGYMGNSAKLGKLIIEDEGLKMCDLIVAACMGVWWQHYERKFND